MARPCSQDLRDRVLASVDDGMSPGEVAELFQVDVTYVYKVVICRRTTNALPN
jgi:transposase